MTTRIRMLFIIAAFAASMEWAVASPQIPGDTTVHMPSDTSIRMQSDTAMHMLFDTLPHLPLDTLRIDTTRHMFNLQPKGNSRQRFRLQPDLSGMHGPAAKGPMPDTR